MIYLISFLILHEGEGGVAKLLSSLLGSGNIANTPFCVYCGGGDDDTTTTVARWSAWQRAPPPPLFDLRVLRDKTGNEK